MSRRITQSPQVTLTARVDVALRERLVRAAEKSGKSLSSLIGHALSVSLPA